MSNGSAVEALEVLGAPGPKKKVKAARRAGYALVEKVRAHRNSRVILVRRHLGVLNKKYPYSGPSNIDVPAFASNTFLAISWQLSGPLRSYT